VCEISFVFFSLCGALMAEWKTAVLSEMATATLQTKEEGSETEAS